MKTWWISKIAKGLAFIVVMVALFGFVVMELWNVLIPDIFNGPVISFWQAIGILILGRLIFDGSTTGGNINWRRSSQR